MATKCFHTSLQYPFYGRRGQMQSMEEIARSPSLDFSYKPLS